MSNKISTNLAVDEARTLKKERKKKNKNKQTHTT